MPSNEDKNQEKTEEKMEKKPVKRTAKKRAGKGAEEDMDMQAFMDSRKGKMQEIIDCYLAALMDQERIENAPLNQLATAFGAVVDRAAKNTTSGSDSLRKLDRLLEEFQDAAQ